MYSIKVLPSAKGDLIKLKRQAKLFEQVKEKILSLREDPRPQGCNQLIRREGYRIRIRDYRVLYEINDEAKIIYIFRVRHRRDVYNF